MPKVSSLHNFQFYPKTTKIRPLFHPAWNNQSRPQGFSKGPGQGWWKTQLQLNPLRTRGFKTLARNWTQRFSLIRNYSRLYWFATRWGARRARYNKYGYSLHFYAVPCGLEPILLLDPDEFRTRVRSTNCSSVPQFKLSHCASHFKTELILVDSMGENITSTICSIANGEISNWNCFFWSRTIHFIRCYICVVCYSSVIGVFLCAPCDSRNSSSFMDFIRGCGDCPNVAPRWSRVLLADMFSIVSCGGAAWSCERKLVSFGGVVPKAPG